ncbi:hypothetical protein CIB48_g11895 [Xylaria polymorpha]|nr:hypothetical protein CIB48_g11895 [Xylaria polymorpha]
MAGKSECCKERVVKRDMSTINMARQRYYILSRVRVSAVEKAINGVMWLKVPTEQQTTGPFQPHSCRTSMLKLLPGALELWSFALTPQTDKGRS